MASFRFSAFLPILFTLIAFGQSPLTLMAQPVFNGDVAFTTQAQLNAWNPAFTSVTGMVTIAGADITDLSPLQNIASVGRMFISNNPSLPSLNGLNALQTVVGAIGMDIAFCPLLTNLNGLNSLTKMNGTLKIVQNNALNSLDGLGALDSIGGFFIMTFNPALTSLTDLSSLTHASSLFFDHNDALSTLDGLDAMTATRSIFLRNHASLNSIAALSNITTALGQMEVIGNAALPNLDGFGGLDSVTKITIVGNTALANVDGLAGISFASIIDIRNNPALTNLDGLSGITSLPEVDLGDGEDTGVLRVSGNAQLSDCCGIYTLLNTPGAIPGLTDIHDNQTGCDSPSEVLEVCDPCAGFPIEPNCQSITVHLSANGTVIVPAADLDNGSTGCGDLEFTVNGQPTATFDCSDLGPNPVTLTITDASGASGTCAVTVTVADDLAPTITCPADQTVAANTTCDGTVGDHTWQAVLTDNCSTSNITVTQSPAANTPLHGHNDSKTLTLSAYAPNDDNPIGTCTFKVTLKDLTPPSITCPGNLVRNTDPNLCSAIVAYANPTASDHCTEVDVAPLPPSLPSGSAFPKGVNSVVWEATDGAGLTQRCTFTVTVNDLQKPIAICPSHRTQGTDAGQCYATVNYPDATATDNCPNVTTQHVSGGISGTQFPKGQTTVQWKAVDAAGNTKTCTFRITVNDTQAPSIACPPNQTATTAPNTCASASTTYPNVTFTDNCPGGFVVKISGLASGSDFPKGANTVVWKATDGAGLTKTCSFTVTVTDEQAPGISCPSNISATAEPGQCSMVVVYADAVSTDNCGWVTPYLLIGLASGSVFPQGATTNVWRAADQSGQGSTCSFTVTVSCGTSQESPEASERNLNFEGSMEAAEDKMLMDLTPNPAVTEVQVWLEGSVSETLVSQQVVTMFDALGRMVWQQALADGQTQITVDLSRFDSGAYWVSWLSAGKALTKRLIVQK